MLLGFAVELSRGKEKESCRVICSGWSAESCGSAAGVLSDEEVVVEDVSGVTANLHLRRALKMEAHRSTNFFSKKILANLAYEKIVEEVCVLLSGLSSSCCFCEQLLLA